MTGRLLVFPWRRHLSIDDGKEAAERILATPIAERRAKAKELLLEDPSTIVFLLGRFTAQIESAPANVHDEAEFLYWFIGKPRRKIGVFDEREYFLGECALLAAKACRFLSRREEARRWMDRSEAGFRLSARHVEDLSRLAYERLASYVEERRFEEVLEMVPELFETMVAHDMVEEAIKTRFLEGWALRETGKLVEAADVFTRVADWARSVKNGARLLAGSYVNLGQIQAALGDGEQALRMATEAMPIFRELNDLLGLAKLRWTIGDTLRAQGKIPAAIEAYREAQKEFGALQMRADVASLHLVIADQLLSLGQERQAEWEVRAALPVLEEEKMIPEGLAAYGLLRESLRRKQINRDALRDLHGYFRHDR